MHFTFTPAPDAAAGAHHATAAARNESVVAEATGVLKDALRRETDVTTLLLRASAGAGKSFALRRMIRSVVDGGDAERVGVVAFTNNQIRSLVKSLTAEMGYDRVAWLISKKQVERFEEEDPAFVEDFPLYSKLQSVPQSVQVLLCTTHRLGAFGADQKVAAHFGRDGAAFDVLFVDEAWQLPEHLFAPVERSADVVVGVGDVGQLPPLEVGDNPWRGDPGYNPYRAWPHSREGEPGTWAKDLPTVWRPAAEQLGVWHAFYPEWDDLRSVAAPGDRRLTVSGDVGEWAPLLEHLADGTPTVLEVDGLPPADAPDVDLPLTQFAGELVDALVAADVVLESAEYDGSGSPTGQTTCRGLHDDGDPVIVVLATRNQAVDDAHEAVDAVASAHDLPTGAVVASTVDSWQGQTNGLTVAVHPLSGAEQLDEFNSAFGRLAVTCTRATHGLLIVTRPGLSDFLGSVPARPGTPFGEPGRRQLPRQTHTRILNAFSRGTVTVSTDDLRRS